MTTSSIRKLTSLGLLICLVGLPSPLPAMEQNVLSDILDSTSLDYPNLLDNRVRAVLNLKAGISLLDKKNYESALRHFTDAAKEDNDNQVRAWAYYYLGKMHNLGLLGLSVEANKEKMFYYLSKAKEAATTEKNDEILSLIKFYNEKYSFTTTLSAFPCWYLLDAVKKGYLELFNIYLSAEANLKLAEAILKKFDNNGNTPLVIAVKNNHVLIAKKIIAHVGLQAIDEDGNSIIHIAVKNRNLPMLRMILEENKPKNHYTSCGCDKALVKDPCQHKQASNFLNKEKLDINFLNDSYRPLDLAVEFNEFAMVELLLNTGAEHTYAGFQTPLLRACIEGLPDIVKLLLDNGADPNEAREEIDWTCLHAAHDNVKIVTLLLNKGANINAYVTEDGGGTPLHHASREGNTETVKLFLAHEANVTMRDEDENTALHHAVQNGHTDIAVLLLTAKSPFDTINTEEETPLHMASMEGYDEIAQILLTMGASPSSLDTMGYTPLHYASRYGHASIVEKLLQCGAAINVAVPENLTPFHLACGNGHLQVVRLLVNKGAQIYDKVQGFSGLCLAAKSGSAETVKFLLETYKDKLPANREISCLSWAIASKDNETLKLLTRHQPTTLLKDENYDQLVMFAIRNGNVFAVQYLLSIGADPTSKLFKYTALRYIAMTLDRKENLSLNLRSLQSLEFLRCFKLTPLAVDDCYIQIATLLLQKEKKLVHATDSQNRSPLHYAVEADNQKLVELLLSFGATNDVLSNKGKSPLQEALEIGNTAIVRTLLHACQRQKN